MEIQFTGGIASSIEDFYATMHPVVVNVQADKPKAESLREFEEEVDTTLGSGVLIHKTGLVLTAFHVVEGSNFITVNRKGEDLWLTTLIAWDIEKDLALLRISEEQVKEAFDYANFAEDDEIKNGHLVFGIGHPYGFEFTLVMGEVTNCRFGKEIIDYEFDENLRTFGKDVALTQINNGHNFEGASGSPFFDSNGRVIGIMVFVLKGFNFAVHLKCVREFLDSNMPDDLKGKENKKKKREMKRENMTEKKLKIGQGR